MFIDEYSSLMIFQKSSSKVYLARRFHVCVLSRVRLEIAKFLFYRFLNSKLVLELSQQTLSKRFVNAQPFQMQLKCVNAAYRGVHTLQSRRSRSRLNWASLICNRSKCLFLAALNFAFNLFKFYLTRTSARWIIGIRWRIIGNSLKFSILPLAIAGALSEESLK